MIIDGKQIAQQFKEAMREQVAALAKQYGRKPCLDVIIVGENPASMSYVKSKIKEMVDVNTIVGEPITSSDGTLIIPVSKVSYGFASGGSDLPTKKESKDCFGGGSGAGVTIQPVAFLTVYQGDVRLINVDGNNTGIDQIISMVPDVVGKVKGIIENRKTKKAQKSGNDFAEITSDDVDV